VTVGQKVKKGDPLFTYDTDKYNDNLAQAQIDLERLNNEKDSINATIAELQKQQKKAKAAEQANYTIQIQEQQLAEKQKELDIQSKQADIDKLNDNIAHATVTSEIDGVVKTIRSGTSNAGASLSGTQDNSFLTVMKSGDYRIKGSINEQNISQIAEGSPMLAVSRTDSSATWRGTVSKIDTSNPVIGTEQRHVIGYGRRKQQLSVLCGAGFQRRADYGAACVSGTGCRPDREEGRPVGSGVSGRRDGCGESLRVGG
jgi:HlyD family secretion protein